MKRLALVAAVLVAACSTDKPKADTAAPAMAPAPAAAPAMTPDTAMHHDSGMKMDSAMMKADTGMMKKKP